MTMFGPSSEYGPVPSYFLAEISHVNVEDHTCSVELLRGQEAYDNVILMRDVGNFSLPKVGDLCSVFWDNSNKPIVNGVYPTFHKDKLDTYKFYNVLAGERMMQSEFGQKLLMTKTGQIQLSNWRDQGILIDERSGLLTVKSDSIFNEAANVTVKSGLAKRYSPVAAKEVTISTLPAWEAPGAVNATTGVGDIVVVEETTSINDTGLVGEAVYEKRVGNVIVAEDGLVPSDVKEIERHPTTQLPLRSKTVHYSKGTLGLAGVEVLIDINGNTQINIPTTAVEDGLTIKGGVGTELTVDFTSIALEGTIIKVDGTTSVEVGNLAAAVDALVKESFLTLYNAHTHPDPTSGSTGPPVVPAVVGVDSTTITKAN